MNLLNNRNTVMTFLLHIRQICTQIIHSSLFIQIAYLRSRPKRTSITTRSIPNHDIISNILYNHSYTSNGHHAFSHHYPRFVPNPYSNLKWKFFTVPRARASIQIIERSNDCSGVDWIWRVDFSQTIKIESVCNHCTPVYEDLFTSACRRIGQFASVILWEK